MPNAMPPGGLLEGVGNRFPEGRVLARYGRGEPAQWQADDAAEGGRAGSAE